MASVCRDAARRLSNSLAAILLTSAFVSARAADALVVAVRDGRPIVVADSATLAAKVIALAQSCSVDSTGYAASKQAWEDVATSRSHIRLVFPEPRKLALVQSGNPRRSELPVEELRLPLPEGEWPAHVFVSSAGATRAVTKCDPIVLRKLVLVQELGLADVAPYSSLLRSGKRQ
jgi:antitoxin (DNA-binding transcriptional repressor) of toxin-antitoxin stability system